MKDNHSVLSVFCLLSCAFYLLSLAGCAENKYAKTTDRLCLPAATKASAMTAGEKVLAEMRFAIEKFDMEAGLIRTAPLRGAQSFEFWRSENIGSFNRTEADIQSIRRTVELNITEQDKQLCINCKATTQRLSMPQGISTDEQGYATLVETHRPIEKLQPTARQKSNITWITLGRDTQLETEIIRRIENQLNVKKEQDK